jgi:hypothetical protein
MTQNYIVTILVLPVLCKSGVHRCLEERLSYSKIYLIFTSKVRVSISYDGEGAAAPCVKGLSHWSQQESAVSVSYYITAARFILT